MICDNLDLKENILSGNTISRGFGYIESKNGMVDFSVIYDLITKGERDGKVLYVVRNYIDSQHTDLLKNNFNNVINQRGSHRNNDGFVSVQQIGSSQFAKNGLMYTRESNLAFNDIDKLFESISAETVESIFLEKFLEENLLSKGIHFRPARYKHGHACFATFRRWLDNGEMSLMPHEDIAQLAYAARDQFEINKAKFVIAHNICIEATGHGGELTVWNLQPDEVCRRNLGVLETGYPYPPDLVNSNLEKFEIKLNAGDIYFMNGCFIHGVKNMYGSRITAGRFIGLIPYGKVVYWT